jgi:hypothetical protein
MEKRRAPSRFAIAAMEKGHNETASEPRAIPQ